VKTVLAQVEECFYEFKKKIPLTSNEIGILITEVEIALATLVRALEEQK
jgi:hypothetical protein